MKAGQLVTDQEIQAFLKLKAENDALKAAVERKQASGGIKVSTKGAVSVYGLGRFPVTLYHSQWETLFAKCEDIKSFINANKSQLKSKEA